MGAKREIYHLKKQDNGFTLLEVCIAMCVLAVSILGVTSLQMNAVRNVTMGNIYSQANTVANQHIEDLKTLPIEILDGWDGVEQTDVAAEPNGPAIFRRRTQVALPAEMTASIDPVCRLITVTVRWRRSEGGTWRSLTVSSLTRGDGI